MFIHIPELHVCLNILLLSHTAVSLVTTLCSVVQLILTYSITEKTDFSFSIRNHMFMVLMKIEPS